MCITRAELNKTVSELKSLKMLKEETEAEIRALENSIIEFLNDTEECETTDKKGKPIGSTLEQITKLHILCKLVKM